MRQVSLSCFFSILISVCLLIGSLPLSIMAQDLITKLSPYEREVITSNTDISSYVYLGQDLSNITKFILQISELDKEANSPLYFLKEHITQGFLLVEYDAMVDVLEYVKMALEKNYKKLDFDYAQKIITEFNTITDLLETGLLTINDSNNDNITQNITRRPNLVIKKNLDVEGKSTFHKHIRTKQGATVSGKLNVGKAALFKDNVTIERNLSVTDATLQNLSVTDLAVVSCVDKLCVNHLSVSDAIINNLTLEGSLSVTDLSLKSLSVTDLAVASCVDKLCINTLSVNDEIIKTFLRLQDSDEDYIGLQAPNVVPTSYTLTLPALPPTANQILRANALTPTNLEWATNGGDVLPTASKTIYVTKYGNDTTGDGSFENPYLTLSKAISVANGIASASNPINILISAGIYVENNSAGPLSITAAGISIIGSSVSGTIISPSTPANNLLSVTNTISIATITFQSPMPLATGIILSAPGLSILTNVRFLNFLIGISYAGNPATICGLNNCFFINNGTAISINNTFVECNNCTILGTPSLTTPAAHTGVSLTGSNGRFIFSGGLCALCTTGFNISNNAIATVNGTSFRFNINDIVQSTASQILVEACSFEFTNGTSDIDVQINGAGTTADIIGCNFHGNSALGIPEGIAIFVTNNASVNINSSNVHHYTTAIQIGTPSDNSSTELFASSVAIRNCTTDVLQEGSTILQFNACVATSSKININDATNVLLAFFDLDTNDSLTIGSTTDRDTTLIQAAITTKNNPEINYKSSIYSTQAIGLDNSLLATPSTWFVLSNNDTRLASITTDCTKIAGVRLVSDEGSPVGGTTALRGWDINKNGSAAELSFNYQNNDIVGQIAIPEFTVMQLDGFNNQLQLPTSGTQIVFAGDTNLYRSSINVLKTDDNMIIGTLIPDRVVVTEPVTNQLASSIVTGTELSYLSGVTSSIQTQLNGKVNKSGDSMTGILQLPAGTTALPSLVFTGSTTTGLSAPIANNLSVNTNGIERMRINSTGIVSMASLTPAGIVHNDSSGNLSSSLIINADISSSAAIADTKLATISTANKVANSATTATSTNAANAIVVRDASGNFSSGTITANLNGNATSATTATTSTTTTNFTGSLLGDVIGTQNATIVNFVGGQAASAVAAATASANNATSTNTANTIVQRDASGDFSVGAISVTDEVISNNLTITPFTTAGIVHNDASGLLSSSLIVNTDIDPAAAIADTKLATISTAGKVANSATTATSTNITNAIVARNASGNFSANIITATLSGAASANVLKTGDTMSGILQLPDGTTASPSLTFTGSTTTGLSAPIANNLSLSTNGLERMKIDSTGTVAIDAFTTTGIVHNDASGNLSSSLIVNNDISNAAISNAKLATISSTDIPGNIIVRDGFGDFATNMITIDGTVTNPTDVATKAYVDSAVSTGLAAKTPALVVSTTNVAITGLFTIDGVGLSANDRVLLIGQTNPVENGLWLAQAGAWTRPADFASSSTVGQAYVLILSGVINEGSSWLSTTPIAVVGTDPINFVLFTLPNTTTGANIGAGTGSVFKNKTGVTLNFRTLLAGTHVIITTNTDEITISTDATDSNTPSTIIVRDASGNFAASTITASLNGAASANVLKTGDIMTGSLDLPAGTTASPSLIFTGSTTTGLSAPITNSLSFSTNAIERMKINATGVVSIDAFTIAGVIHNDASGNLSSSLIVNADVDPAAAIADTKLATISTTGKVDNSATTATSTNTANTIVARDVSGNFSAGTITANLTGAASANVLKAGDIMTGTLQLPAGTTALPSLVFTGSTTTGLSTNASSLSFSTNALERMKIDSTGIVSIDAFTTDGVVHNDSSGNLSSSLIGNADISPSAAIADTKLAAISTAGKVANSATTATSTNTASTIVARDASGNFSADTITANLNGNATTATIATTTTNFDGSLTGDVTGTQGATVVSFVGGQTASAVAAATTLANNATSANTTNTIVQRGSTGNFSAGAISVTDEIISNSLTIIPFTTTGVVHNNASGLLASSLIVNADIDPAAAIADTKLATISTVGKVANSATTATSLNTANAIVARDTSGNFAAGTITANLNGNATTATTATTSTNATNFTGSLAGDVTGTQSVTVVSLVGGQTATNVAAATILSNAATNLNTSNTIVKRDGTGNFAAQVISMTDGVHSGNLILSTNPSTSSAGNILKGANRFIHNFGTNNMFVGINSGNFSMSGTGQNVGLGTNTLVALTTGTDNTALGFDALAVNTVGIRNTAIGSVSLVANTTANNNTAIGYEALQQCTTGSNNTAIGFGAGALLTTGTNNVYINAAAGSASEGNTIRLGSSQSTCFIAGIFGTNMGIAANVAVNSSGQLGVATLSSRKFKRKIHDMNEASDNLFKLRPVTFVYNNDKKEEIRYGLIAEEVNEIFPTIVVKDGENQPYTVQYDILSVFLLNEMKKQQVTIEKQQTLIEQLTTTIERANEIIDALQTQTQQCIERIIALEKTT